MCLLHVLPMYEINDIHSTSIYNCNLNILFILFLMLLNNYCVGNAIMLDITRIVLFSRGTSVCDLIHSDKQYFKINTIKESTRFYRKRIL